MERLDTIVTQPVGKEAVRIILEALSYSTSVPTVAEMLMLNGLRLRSNEFGQPRNKVKYHELFDALGKEGYVFYNPSPWNLDSTMRLTEKGNRYLRGLNDNRR